MPTEARTVEDPQHMQRIFDALMFIAHNPDEIDHGLTPTVQHLREYMEYNVKGSCWEVSFKQKFDRKTTSMPTISGRTTEDAEKFFTDGETLLAQVDAWRALPTKILFFLAFTFQGARADASYEILIDTTNGKLFDYFDTEDDVEVVMDIEEYGVLDYNGKGEPQWKFGYYSYEVEPNDVDKVIGRFREEFEKREFVLSDTVALTPETETLRAPDWVKDLTRHY